MTERLRHTLPLLFASLAAGALALLANGYRFGIGDQVEQLPIVMRILDPEWLASDPYVNSQAGFNPRFYYAHLLAGLTAIAPLWAVCLILQFICNAALAAVSAFSVRAWFGSTPAAILAAFASTAALPFYLGNEGAAWTPMLVSSTPALVLAVAGMALAIEGRMIAAATCCAIGAVFHPLVGLEAGGLSLASGLLGQLLCRRQPLTKSLLHALSAAAILAAASLLWIVPMQRSASFAFRLDDPSYIHLLAHYRAPHHYLPSQWPREHYLWAAVFYCACAISWLQWVRSSSDRARQTFVGLLFCGVFFCYGFGWFFVEVLPVRTVVILQLYRLSFIGGWLGVMLLCGSFGRTMASGAKADALIAASGILTAGAAFLSQVYLEIRDRWHLPQAVLRVAQAALLSIVAILAIDFDLLTAPRFLALACGIVVAFLAGRSRIAVLAAYEVALAIFAAIIIVRPHAFAAIRPVFTLSQAAEVFEETDAFARHSTQPDALFLTPPDWGSFRLTAERAILVDWKTFSFQDAVMQDWHQRLEAVHGLPQGKTWRPGELEQRYRQISDGTLMRLRREYGIDYAILYSDTPTSLDTVYKTRSYRIVRLP